MRLIIYFIITILLIVLVVYGANNITEYATSENAKIVVKWFVLLAIMNIIIFMFILASYDTLKFKQGPPGPTGKRGSDGPSGRDGSCIMCSPAISGLKPIRPYHRIDRIDPMTEKDENEQIFVRSK